LVFSVRIRSELSRSADHQGGQILQRGEDVVAVIAQRRKYLRQFDDRVTDARTLAT